MKINQVFKILSNASNTHIAKIIIGNRKTFSTLWVLNAARKLKRGFPVAKIINSKWFYGLQFYTNKYTLDPRPDSETLVQAVLDTKPKNVKILDMGTGTGCLLISLIKNILNATGIGVDKSAGAVHVARKNVKKFKLKNKIKILRKSFNSKLPEKFDIIISNPPYIAYGDTRVNNAAMFDPKISLYAKNNGLAAYEQIAKSAKNLLNPNGQIYLEIGDGQTDSVRQIFESENWKFFESFKDLGNIERVLKFTL